MNDLKISFIQSELIWENPEKNLSAFANKIQSINDKTDIIVLPEMFNTAFSINPEKCAERMDGFSFNWLKDKAKEMQVVITGSILINEGGKYYNRMIWMQKDGNFLTYDKRHLFRMSDEFKIFNAGKERRIIEYKGWKINLNICYDLRFPVWTKNTFKDGNYEYDLLINVANWPAGRSFIWKTLLRARAIENQAYVVGVNRVGNDGFGTAHSGDSMAIDPMGNIIIQAEAFAEEVHTITLSKDFINDFRNKFTVGFDWDKFELI